MSYHQNPEDVHLWEQIETGSQPNFIAAARRAAEGEREHEHERDSRDGCRRDEAGGRHQDQLVDAGGMLDRHRGGDPRAQRHSDQVGLRNTE